MGDLAADVALAVVVVRAEVQVAHAGVSQQLVFHGPFPDASLNPAFNPVQMYRQGLWFNSPKDATAAGCAGATTPFNGKHDAGVQALSTRNCWSICLRVRVLATSASKVRR